MFDDIIVVCRKCNKKVHPSELRKEDQNSNVLICTSCYNKAKDVSDSLEEIKKNMTTTLKGEKIKYYCEACGFKFTRNKSANKSCPYCNKDAVKQVDIKLVREFKDIK